ncbi:MAG: hypothetical protein KatS3mg109_1186 [Pirellulaceae bacterium]|nr:MAG: hypothetical protein KatS3mg109_1142 [Pirellulaceae bacterium]GIW90754.1 MAG: hypothetical protein KatS3mg109_1186 [Pirellulaceae bacterium]GIW94266.1 MAG: hypothetical protein KatS3mg110_2307 [Pirellulaceae bacterium]
MDFFDENERNKDHWMAAELILPFFPDDTRDRVTITVQQYNNIVRDKLRKEMGLRLADKESRISVPVRVVDGFTNEVVDVINKFADQIRWLLIGAKEKLAGAKEGLEFLVEHWWQLEKWDRLPREARNSVSALETSLNVVNVLSKISEMDQVFDGVKQIQKDILGAYFPGVGYRFGPPRIEIYWMAIGLFARVAGVSIEDLTVAALVHELGHAYSHVGRDIDGRVWEDSGFIGSDLEVVEGLAQFYTEEIAEELRPRAPGVLLAYEALLPFLAPPYHAHKRWKEVLAERGVANRCKETVRYTLIRARQRGAIKNKEWEELLVQTCQTLRT